MTIWAFNKVEEEVSVFKDQEIMKDILMKTMSQKIHGGLNIFI